MLKAIRETRTAVGTNTNLGMVLLLAPLASVPIEQTLTDGIGRVLEQLTSADTSAVYEAIQISSAGGLGHSDQADVYEEAPPQLTLVDAMRLAANRDLIARQYVNGFLDVFNGPSAWIAEALASNLGLSDAIIHSHVRQLASHPDSLIQRKCGSQVANEASTQAAEVLKCGMPGDSSYERAISELDEWLRADGHRRNPGTSADLIAAGLFVLLREGRLHWRVW